MLFRRSPEEKAIEKGLEYQNSDNYERAEQEFKKAIEINPKNTEACYYLGGLYKIQGKNEQAISSYEKALDIDPANGRARYMLKLLQTEGGIDIPGASTPKEKKQETPPPVDYDKIREGLEKEIKETYEAGIEFAKKENLSEAINQWEKAVKLNPNNAKVRYNLAVAYVRTGYQVKATAQLRQAVKINPAYQLAKEALTKLTGKEQ